MFNVTGISATLIQRGRNSSDSIYTDGDTQTVSVRLCPYNVNQGISFGRDTIAQASGYFVVPRGTDIKEGDQLTFDNHTFSVLEVQDNWLFNRVENIRVAVK